LHAIVTVRFFSSRVNAFDYLIVVENVRLAPVSEREEWQLFD
jgi:hypothetical protein